jgi:hypothetical protein
MIRKEIDVMAAKHRDSGNPSPANATAKLIDLRAVLSGKVPQGLVNFLVPAADHLLLINKINRIFRACPARIDATAFCR